MALATILLFLDIQLYLVEFPTSSINIMILFLADVVACRSRHWTDDHQRQHCSFLLSVPHVSEMTYTVSRGTLNSTIPYHTHTIIFSLRFRPLVAVWDLGTPNPPCSRCLLRQILRLKPGLQKLVTEFMISRQKQNKLTSNMLC